MAVDVGRSRCTASWRVNIQGTDMRVDSGDDTDTQYRKEPELALSELYINPEANCSIRLI